MSSPMKERERERGVKRGLGDSPRTIGSIAAQGLVQAVIQEFSCKRKARGTAHRTQMR